MGHHAGEARARGRVENAGDGEQAVIVMIDARPVLAAINLDQGRVAARMGGDGLCHLHTVDQDLQVRALSRQRGGAVQLRGRDDDRIENVGKAMFEQIFRFRQRRDGDAARLARRRDLCDLRRFAGFHMRAQGHAKLGGTRAHTGAVSLHPALVEDQAGGLEVGEFHGCSRG